MGSIPTAFPKGSVQHNWACAPRFNIEDKMDANGNADGRCKVCEQPIPHVGHMVLSQYHCSEECRRKGWIASHPELPVPDWDELEAEIVQMFGPQLSLPRWRKRTGLAKFFHNLFNKDD